jgi:hypothetical protein
MVLRHAVDGTYDLGGTSNSLSVGWCTAEAGAHRTREASTVVPKPPEGSIVFLRIQREHMMVALTRHAGADEAHARRAMRLMVAPDARRNGAPPRLTGNGMWGAEGWRPPRRGWPRIAGVPAAAPSQSPEGRAKSSAFRHSFVRVSPSLLSIRHIESWAAHEEQGLDIRIGYHVLIA